MFQQTSEVSLYCTKFLRHMTLPHPYGQMLTMDARKREKKNIFYDKLSKEIEMDCQKMTNCLVEKCALISVRYTFLTHSHT